MSKLSEAFVLNSLFIIVFGVTATLVIFIGIPLWVHWWDVVKDYWRIS